MAGDWIKIENVTPDKPEVFEIAEMLSIDPDAVVGKLIRCWIWADQQLRDGNAPRVTKALLDRISSVNGFATSLLQVGWLVETEAGIAFANFDRHNGATAKKRANSLKRVQKHRENMKRNCNAPSVTKALPEKRREEKSITHTPTQNAGGFENAWERWVRYIESINGRRNEIQEEIWLMDLNRRGPEKAAKDIEFSISKGAKSLLDSDNDFSKQHRGNTARKVPSLEDGVI